MIAQVEKSFHLFICILEKSCNFVSINKNLDVV
jgi:hypothetical protein